MAQVAQSSTSSSTKSRSIEWKPPKEPLPRKPLHPGPGPSQAPLGSQRVQFTHVYVPPGHGRARAWQSRAGPGAGAGRRPAPAAARRRPGNWYN